MPAHIYWVYVLRNPTGKFYIGLTDDVVRRLSDHNSGLSAWTNKFGPWEVVWRKGPMTLTEGRKLENWLKRQKGGVGFYAFAGLVARQAHNPALRDREPRRAGSRSAGFKSHPRNQFAALRRKSQVRSVRT